MTHQVLALVGCFPNGVNALNNKDPWKEPIAAGPYLIKFCAYVQMMN